MFILGITGPTGAGKTTALEVLERMGGYIVDADAVYHQLLRENRALRAELETRFGPLQDEQGGIDRKKLGAVVFHDRKAMGDLNTITGRYIPDAIGQRIRAAGEQGYRMAAIDAIRLLEGDLAGLCHATLAVLAPADVRVKRIMAREGIPEEYAAARVNAQQNDEFYIRGCGYVLYNDCSSAREFGEKARAVLEEILEKENA